MVDFQYMRFKNRVKAKLNEVVSESDIPHEAKNAIRKTLPWIYERNASALERDYDGVVEASFKSCLVIAKLAFPD